MFHIADWIGSKLLYGLRSVPHIAVRAVADRLDPEVPFQEFFWIHKLIYRVKRAKSVYATAPRLAARVAKGS